MLCALELCLFNGCFDPTKDNFTSVSSKGVSVVDYCITPPTAMGLFNNYQVQDIHDIIVSNDIPIDSAIPDHRLLTVEIRQSLISIRKSSYKKPVTIKKIPPEYTQNTIAMEK